MRSLCNSAKGHSVAPFLNNQSDRSKVPQTIILQKKKKKKKKKKAPLSFYGLHKYILYMLKPSQESTFPKTICGKAAYQSSFP